MQNRYHQIIVAAIVVVFILLQLTILSIFGYTPYPDSQGYILLAKECLAHNELYPIASNLHELPFVWNVGSINLTFFSLKLFNSIVPLLVLYSLMKGFSAWLVYETGRRLSSYNVGIIALFIYILYPANYGEGTSLLSETPFIFFSLAAIVAVLSHRNILAASLLVAANWMRPMAVIFVIAIVIYYIAYGKKKRISVFIASYLLGIALIGTLSHHRTGHFIYQAKTGWMALMQYSWDHDSDQTDDYALFKYKDPNYISSKDNYDAVERDSVWQSHFWIWLQNNPDEYFKQMPRKFVNTFATDNVNFCTFIPDKSEAEYMYHEVSMPVVLQSMPKLSAVQVLTVVNLIVYYTLMFFAALSVLKFIRIKKYKIIVLPFTVISTGTLLLLFVGHGEARFHQPFMPFIILLVALYINFVAIDRKFSHII